MAAYTGFGHGDGGVKKKKAEIFWQVGEIPDAVSEWISSEVEEACRQCMAELAIWIDDMDLKKRQTKIKTMTVAGFGFTNKKGIGDVQKKVFDVLEVFLDFVNPYAGFESVGAEQRQDLEDRKKAWESFKTKVDKLVGTAMEIPTNGQ